MILAAIVIAKNPSQYGFQVEPEMPLIYEKAQVSDPIDLRLIAEWTNAPIDQHRSAEPRASPLDDARALAELRDQAARRHR